MSSTTQTDILFNSPALHALKRDQLVKLCKIHSIKASGKSVDLIQKLQQHACSLQHDDLDNTIPYSSLPPPNSLPQTDHFTFSTPDSSIHDINSPIPGHTLRPGLPVPSNARLSTGHNAGYANTTTIRLVTAAACPPRQGHPSTPQLRPFETTFDLEAGSPFGGGRMDVWPREDADGLYPVLPELDAPPRPEQGQGRDNAMPAVSPYTSDAAKTTPTDIFSPGHATTPLRPPVQPFIFGSPLPQHNLTNTQFRSAAASVLDEMNRRLAGEGVAGVGLDILDLSKTKGPRGLDLGGGEGDTRGPSPAERFHRMHEQEFEKMDSIASHYAARRDSPERPGKRKSSVLDAPGGGIGAGGKRRPSGVRPGGMRVISQGARRKMVIPGGFGLDEDEGEDEDGGRRVSKRPKVGGDVDERTMGKDKRVSIAIPSPRDDRAVSPEVQDTESEKEEKRKQKEREAIRRKLELNKARRRSSMGRVSVGGGKAPLIPNQKAKGTTSRFGFLSSAKSMMQSVWNRGTAKSATSSIPVSKPAPAPAPKAPPETKMAPPLLRKAPPAARPSAADTRNTGPGRVPSAASRLLKPTTDKGTLSSTRSRSPIPSFSGPPPSTRSAIGSVGSSRTGSSIGTAASGSRAGSAAGSSHFGTRTSSLAAPSSIGTRGSGGGVIARLGSRVSSLGTRGSRASTADAAGSAGAKRVGGGPAKGGPAGGQDVRKKAATAVSRLMAPTASSLARTQSVNSGVSSSRPSISVVPAQEQEQEQEQAQGAKTPSLPSVIEDRPTTPHDGDAPANSPSASLALAQMRSPRPASGRVFSKPLVGPSSIPTPARPPLAATQARAAAADAPSVKGRARKPRISRSRVIARLASQRAASGSGVGAGRPSGAGRTRSSLGAAKRQSVGGGVLMSARKRARQSEYARRSRGAGGAGSPVRRSVGMGVGSGV